MSDRVLNTLLFLAIQQPASIGTLLDISEPSPVNGGISLDFPSASSSDAPVTEDTLRK